MERETDQVLMNINRTAGGIVSAALFSVHMSFKLVTFLMRMAQKGLVASGMTDAFKNFNEKTSGKFTVYNIPLSMEKAQMMDRLNELNLQAENTKNPIKAALLRNEIKNLEKGLPEIMQLKQLGIDHCVLPKLNGSSQTIQVAVSNKDDQHFKNWYLNHISTELGGGEKNLEAIKVFTEGNYTILNVPFEQAEDLGIMFHDFNKMAVNYAVCPDLNVGDGYTQVAIPNADRERVEDWFRLWKQKQLAEGKDGTKEMYAMDENSYAATGEVSTEEYIASSDKKFQEANREFEERAKELPWNHLMKHENSPEYVKFYQDNNYEKITINRETLVDKMDTGSMEFLVKHAKENGYFLSRIPGTWGEKQETLVLPLNQVFTTDDGKTLVAFLHKGKDYMVADINGKVARKSFMDMKESYDKVTRNINKVEEMKQGMSVKQEISPNLDIVPSINLPKI